MIDRMPDENIPDHRVPDILARAVELDRSPRCAELILPGAKICRFCRSDLTETGGES